MEQLIEALQIFMKYGNPKFPTHCEHDILYISADIDPEKVSDEDKARLKELEFLCGDPDDSGETFYSYHYGSC